MKKIKLLLGAFIISCVLSVSGVSAKYLSFVGVKLPAWSGVYTSSKVTKSTNGYQYIKTSGATDLLSGDGRAISARVYGAGTSYVGATTGKWIKLQDNNQYTTVAGIDYQIQLKATKSTLSKVSYNGIWDLDYKG